MTNSELLDDKFYETNPLFTSTSAIIEFTKPLKKLNLSYFTFDRHYIDNSRISLTSSVDWIRHYWEYKLYEKSVFERDHLKFSGGHVLWSWLSREPVYSTASLYGIDHGITIAEKHGDYCDFLNFGSVNNDAVTSEYLIKNLPFLYQFTAFFKYRMKDLISNAEKNKFKVSVPQCDNISRIKLDAEIDGKIFCQSMDQKNTSRIYLGDDFKNSYLTRKEFELANLLIHGLNASAAAAKLGVSNDTVNKHIKNLKAKLNCSTLCELGFAMSKIGGGISYNLKIWK
jgi:DNA-binding CsgD family transcriptional regulator